MRQSFFNKNVMLLWFAFKCFKLFRVERQWTIMLHSIKINTLSKSFIVFFCCCKSLSVVACAQLCFAEGQECLGKCCMLLLLHGVLSLMERWNNLVNVSLFFSFFLFWYTKKTFKTVQNSVPSDYIRAAQYLIAEQRDTFLPLPSWSLMLYLYPKNLRIWLHSLQACYICVKQIKTENPETLQKLLFFSNDVP